MRQIKTKDKFRVYLRRNTAVCVRNNTTVVLVLHNNKNEMNITLRSLEKKLYNNYSFHKTINELLDEYYICNSDLHDHKPINIPDFLMKVNLLEKEVNELKLGGKHFTEFGEDIERYLLDLYVK